ncbi:MAG TPA: serine/threonine-protein kinase [Polyangiaceae bacterium]|jgi:serine/threonine-protein kinase
MPEPTKYRRIVELGRGGMAVVSLTAMRSSHDVTKLVVVKELQANLAADPEYRTMFLDEARLAARLNHPNVVQTFEIVDHVGASATDGLEGVCALVMEYLDGQALNRIRARMKDDSRALGVYLAVVIEALSGLEYAHTLLDYSGKPLGIVHRDVSPHNIFVTYSGEVKVLDFGIAKANDASSAPTQVGTVKGKLGYMAPEQARGDRVDARADVFACGVILWEAAVRRRLWAGLPEPAIMYKLSQGEIPAPRDVAPAVPEALDAICRKALAHDPAGRYESAAKLRDDLEAFVATLPGRPTRRNLGEIVSGLFAEERTQVRKLIEEELGRVAAASTSEFSALALRSLPRLPGANDSSSSVDRITGPTGPTGPTQVNAASSVVPPARSRAPLFVALGVGAAVALGFGAVGVARFGSHAAPAPSAASEPPSSIARAPAVSAAAALPGRRVLAVDPPTARVTVDGAPLAPGAHSIDGGAPVMLHVEAEGYAPADVRVAFDTSDPIVIRLAPIPAATATARPPVVHHGHPTAHPTATAHATASPTDIGY